MISRVLCIVIVTGVILVVAACGSGPRHVEPVGGSQRRPLPLHRIYFRPDAEPRTPSVLLVGAGSEIEALQNATPALQGDAPAPVVSSSAPQWIVAYFGFSSSPVPWVADSVRIGDGKVWMTYHRKPSPALAADHIAYACAAPVGRLPRGEYMVELVDSDRDTTAAARKQWVE